MHALPGCWGLFTGRRFPAGNSKPYHWLLCAYCTTVAAVCILSQVSMYRPAIYTCTTKIP